MTDRHSPMPSDDASKSSAHGGTKEKTPSEDAIDEGVEESFPASDPVSVTADKVRNK